LPDLRLLDLRHSFASFLVNSGVSLYVVQGLLGHAHTRYTQRYAHLTPDTLLDAAETVSGLVSENRRAPPTDRADAMIATHVVAPNLDGT
jgi:site-specific recombinase XerC